MEQFLGFAIPGVPYGCTYAIVAVALVLTYRATGVFNFAFAAQAYVASLLFTALIQSAHFPVWLAFVIAVVVVSPLLGLGFDRLLFSRIPNSNNMAKLVTSISLLVGIPALMQVFIPQNYYAPPSIVFDPNTVYFTLAGAPFNGLDMSAVVFSSVVLAAMGIMMRLTPLGLQMRGAVESRRLVQLDGVNAGGVVAVAWMISSFLAGLAGILLAPNFGQVQAQPFLTLMVAAIAAAACAAFRSMAIAALAAVAIGITTFTLQGYLPTQSFLFTSILPSLPFLVLVGALLFHPGMRNLEKGTDPLATVDPPLPPLAAAVRTPAMGRVIRILWYVLLGVFIVSMLTWMPRDWESVLNQGLAFSTLFLSITLITGMGGQLSLAQAGLAGVGAFTAAQLANHLGLSMMAGMLVGAAFAAAVAIVLAALSLRLRGLGLALMTLGAALVFDNVIQSSQTLGGGSGGLGPLNNVDWGSPFGLLNPDGHALFLATFAVLVVVVLAILMIRRGTVGRFLGAMRGSDTAAAGIGINLTWQRILIFALSGAVAGIGGTLLVVQQGVANPQQFNYVFSLAFVVIVVTTGVTTVEGAIQGAFGYVIIQKLLGYAPPQFANLTFVLFAFGALTYAKHPEGILEFQKRRSMQRFEPLFERWFPRPQTDPGPAGNPMMAGGLGEEAVHG
jgi:ABC-type branched-subunit amino acid transport system permease subunit